MSEVHGGGRARPSKGAMKRVRRTWIPLWPPTSTTAIMDGMDDYTVETDGLRGFLVKVTRPDGAVYITSASLPTLTDTRNWIDEHRRSAAKIAAATRSEG